MSARGRTTAIEATSPKRNQSKTGGADGPAARPEAGQRRRRPSSRSAAVPEPGPPARAGTRTRGRAQRRRESHRSGRASRPAGSIPARRWRSAGRLGLFALRASRRVDPEQRQQDAEAGGKANGEHLADDPRRRRPARRRPATHGEAALVIPTIAASRKLTITTAATGSRPHSGRASPSITRSLRCSLIADSRRYATEPRAAARRGAISAAGTACRRAPERPAPSPRPASSRSEPSSGSCRRPAGACSGTGTAACPASGRR